MTRSLKTWHTDDFIEAIKKEICSLNVDQLPLQQSLSQSSIALDKDLTALIQHSSEDRQFIKVKAGIFYKGIIAGCNCADDPSPIDEYDEYCEVVILINKDTAATTVSPASNNAVSD